ncbi:Ribonuclease H-like superfamily protein [Euphorbia peplus]|nr:Ribonuclease H-like superfamily protein [Euphorbia peplus]
MKCGGIGIKDLFAFNLAILGKVAWALISDNSFIPKLFKIRFLSPSRLPKLYISNSLIWCSIRASYQRIRDDVQWFICSSSELHFWVDFWIRPPLVDQLDTNQNQRLRLIDRVDKFLTDANWVNLPTLPSHIEQHIRSIRPSLEVEDFCVWTNSSSGKFCVKDYYSSLIRPRPVQFWGTFTWQRFIPPSRSMISWRLLHRGIPTHENLQRRGHYIVSVCYLCNCNLETSNHLFLQCSFAVILWNVVKNLFGIQINLSADFSNLLRDVMAINFESPIAHNLDNNYYLRPVADLAS